jgi:adenylate kinase
VFVLRKAPWKLKYELERRGYQPRKVWENLEAELLGICLKDSKKHHNINKICEIDTTNLTPVEIVDKIISILKNDSPCKILDINWSLKPEILNLLKGKKCIS